MKKLLFPLLICGFISCNTEEESKNEKLLDYEITTIDIDHFWLAYDSLKNSKDSVETIQKLFIDTKTPEFGEFLKVRERFTAQRYVSDLKSHPKFWRSVRPFTLGVKNDRQEIDVIYHKMAHLYDSFKAPNICFAISPISSGGTTSEGLILIGTEIAAVNPKKVDLSELTGFMGEFLKNNTGKITGMIAHELVHTQQKYTEENESLLLNAIIEGSASFIADLIMGELTLDKTIFEYGEANEKALWVEFENDFKENKTMDETDWFYDYHSDRPADLGYYIGYKISKSYFENSDDKNKLLKKSLK